MLEIYQSSITTQQAFSSENLVTYHHNTRRHIPDDSIIYNHEVRTPKSFKIYWTRCSNRDICRGPIAASLPHCVTASLVKLGALLCNQCKIQGQVVRNRAARGREWRKVFMRTSCMPKYIPLYQVLRALRGHSGQRILAHGPEIRGRHSPSPIEVEGGRREEFLLHKLGHKK
jgi:hypothetical protein